MDKHINTLEMKALLNALMIPQYRRVGQDIVLMLDNSFMVVYINKGRGHIQSSLSVVKRDLPVDREAFHQSFGEIYSGEAECGG